MTEDVIADLKQFITATVSRQITSACDDLRTDLRAEFHTEFKRINDKVNDGFKRVDTGFKRVDEEFKRVDGEFKKIEKEFKKVNDKINTLSLAIGDTMDATNVATDKRLGRHNDRLALLEGVHGIKSY